MDAEKKHASSGTKAIDWVDVQQRAAAAVSICKIELAIKQSLQIQKKPAIDVKTNRR